MYLCLTLSYRNKNGPSHHMHFSCTRHEIHTTSNVPMSGKTHMYIVNTFSYIVDWYPTAWILFMGRWVIQGQCSFFSILLYVIRVHLITLTYLRFEGRATFAPIGCAKNGKQVWNLKTYTCKNQWNPLGEPYPTFGFHKVGNKPQFTIYFRGECVMIFRSPWYLER